MADPHILGSKPDCFFMISIIVRQSSCLCLSSTVLIKFGTLVVVSVVFAFILAIYFFCSLVYYLAYESNLMLIESLSQSFTGHVYIQTFKNTIKMRISSTKSVVFCKHPL